MQRGNCEMSAGHYASCSCRFRVEFFVGGTSSQFKDKSLFPFLCDLCGLCSGRNGIAKRDEYLRIVANWLLYTRLSFGHIQVQGVCWAPSSLPMGYLLGKSFLLEVVRIALPYLGGGRGLTTSSVARDAIPTVPLGSCPTTILFYPSLPFLQPQKAR